MYTDTLYTGIPAHRYPGTPITTTTSHRPYRTRFFPAPTAPDFLSKISGICPVPIAPGLSGPYRTRFCPRPYRTRFLIQDQWDLPGPYRARFVRPLPRQISLVVAARSISGCGSGCGSSGIDSGSSSSGSGSGNTNSSNRISS